MKQSLFFLLAFVLLTITTRAQIAKGSVLLGGNFRVFLSSTDHGTSTESRQNGFVISPVYGKATRENLVWGVEAGLGSTTTTNDNTNFKQTGYSLSLGAFVRKYKPVGKSGFYMFVQGKLAATYGKSESRITTNPSTTKEDTKSIGLYVNPGVSFALSKRFHLESGFNNLISLSYYSVRQKQNTTVEYKTSGVDLSANLSNMSSAFYLGFRILLDKSKS